MWTSGGIVWSLHQIKWYEETKIHKKTEAGVFGSKITYAELIGKYLKTQRTTNILDRKGTRTLFTGPEFFCGLIRTQVD